MTVLQILGFIGIAIFFIGTIFLSAGKGIKFGLFLIVTGVFIALVGGIGHQAELDWNTPTALDVYRGKTTLEITYRDSVAIDSTVVYKVE